MDYWLFPYKYLFHPIGATSFVIELDSSGTFMASSFGYATPRDWSKLSHLLLNNQQYTVNSVNSATSHENEELNDNNSSSEVLVPMISTEYINFIRTPNPSSGGHYGGHFWLNPAIVDEIEYNILPPDDRSHLQNEWMMKDLPKDTYYMSGHDGQNVYIIPSLNLSIIRIGFTHSDDIIKYKLKNWNHEDFYSMIIKCIV